MHCLDRLKIYWFHWQKNRLWPGLNHKILGWSSYQEQQMRFSTIGDAAEFRAKSVIDLGCGMGELYDYLTQDQCLASYLGIDQHWPFLQQARQRVGSAHCRFKYGDISKLTLPVADIIVASGSLSYRSTNKNYLSQMITRMHNAANETVIFNLLNSDTFPQQKTLQPYNKRAVYRFCKTISAHVRVIDDYSKSDFTIVLDK
ncbi:class I SAM-dependent methyltransferase [Vibrio ostreicida]|uniref:Class I SAM-dependent methyltransferase n=1 Tax=Vibrio ostreicida TaxID=526588 RepID=A0ABT8BRU4_9VIBR|nr:class I SAM-dependent methyltransferase [Vibrio ostreicida]MDN3609537.1 class I SAM-dependent methyltransferase [Vibrio ostreicida]NPD08413.1 class I SAM-dependent methyltransferase [Vibrio ostreicida]